MLKEQLPRGNLLENCDPVKESQLSSTSRTICHALGNSKNNVKGYVNSSVNFDLLGVDTLICLMQTI